MTSLSGRLSPGALADLLQYLALARASGCLLLRHPLRRQAYVYMERGRVVFVDARPLYDVAALGELLSWKDGRFAFRPEITAPRRTLDMSTEHLLIEATRRVDERDPGRLDPDTVLTAVSLEDAARARATRPRPVRQLDDGAGPFGAVRVLGDARPFGPQVEDDESVSLSLAALHLWRRLDGVSSLRELATAAGRPVAEVVDAGAELLEAGLAEYVAVTVADPRFTRELVREAVDLLGPVGEIVVEDALYELGLSGDAVPVGRAYELVRTIEEAFDDGQARREFARRAAMLMDLFALVNASAGR